jgi:adenine specific DNA methylase Mod
MTVEMLKPNVSLIRSVRDRANKYQFERRWYGSNPEQLRVLSEWLIEQQVEEVVMESTAQY